MNLVVIIRLENEMFMMKKIRKLTIYFSTTLNIWLRHFDFLITKKFQFRPRSDSGLVPFFAAIGRIKRRNILRNSARSGTLSRAWFFR